MEVGWLGRGENMVRVGGWGRRVWSEYDKKKKPLLQCQGMRQKSKLQDELLKARWDGVGTKLGGVAGRHEALAWDTLGASLPQDL